MACPSACASLLVFSCHSSFFDLHCNAFSSPCKCQLFSSSQSISSHTSDLPFGSDTIPQSTANMAEEAVPPEHIQTANASRAPRASFARGRGGGACRADRGQGVPSRGRGRGSGARQNKSTRNQLQQPQPQNLATENKTSPSEQTPARQSLDAENLGEDTEDLEADICFICASPVVHNSIAPCNHRTCHICALRLRALYKTKACAHCRVR